ncbi:MAG: hypothetical protein QOK82_08045, partial [Nitrososphaeraceae archaeon]|nr:hypothetical protein [Nitrososphaeraceae archaeon]
MKSKSTINNNVCRNGLFVASVFLIFVSAINFTHQNTITHAQSANDKGYDLNEMGGGAYVVSSTGYNSMFLVTGEGGIVVDAHPNIGEKIIDAISEVNNETVKYLVYSHAH